MARRFVVALVTLTLLWTGTLLHDAFSNSEGHHHAHFSALVEDAHDHQHDSSLIDDHDHESDNHEVGLSGAQFAGSDSEFNSEEHCHGPAVTAPIKAHTPVCLDNVPVLISTEPARWLSRLELLSPENFSRPPPLTNRQFRTRLYLVNRTLLI